MYKEDDVSRESHIERVNYLLEDEISKEEYYIKDTIIEGADDDIFEDFKKDPDVKNLTLGQQQLNQFTNMQGKVRKQADTEVSIKRKWSSTSDIERIDNDEEDRY